MDSAEQALREIRQHKNIRNSDIKDMDAYRRKYDGLVARFHSFPKEEQNAAARLAFSGKMDNISVNMPKGRLK